jgi:hypothetical protein
MKTIFSFGNLSMFPGCRRRALSGVMILALCGLQLATLHGADPARIYATPEQAVAALYSAVSETNRTALDVVFGPGAKALTNPDTVQGAHELAEFAAAFNAANRLVQHSETCMILEVGTNCWPLPIPLVKTTGGWQFDTVAGVEEIRNRRIGKNELDVLRVMRACVQAQREYASRDRDGDDVLEFAQKFLSSPGETDGLFWPSEVNGEISPLGPLVAYAQGEGYSHGKDGASQEAQPFHGYLFKILTRQGKHAPGGKYDYITNGNMIGGFALVAWPAEYGDSGVMTFIINQQGRVYQRDLGAKTSKTVRKMMDYDPDKNWFPSAD